MARHGAGGGVRGVGPRLPPRRFFRGRRGNRRPERAARTRMVRAPLPRVPCRGHGGLRRRRLCDRTARRARRRRDSGGVRRDGRPVCSSGRQGAPPPSAGATAAAAAAVSSWPAAAAAVSGWPAAATAITSAGFENNCQLRPVYGELRRIVDDAGSSVACDVADSVADSVAAAVPGAAQRQRGGPHCIGRRSA